MMSQMLKPIEHHRVVDQVYEQIRDLIFRGQIKPGERLMPERKMANSLKVGRPAIREAIQKLVQSNLRLCYAGTVRNGEVPERSC